MDQKRPTIWLEGEDLFTPAPTNGSAPLSCRIALVFSHPCRRTGSCHTLVCFAFTYTTVTNACFQSRLRFFPATIRFFPATISLYFRTMLLLNCVIHILYSPSSMFSANNYTNNIMMLINCFHLFTEISTHFAMHTNQ